MRSRLKVVVLMAGFLALANSPVLADAQQYNCNGRIQYRPCGQPLHQYKRNVTSNGKVKKSVKRAETKDPDAFARVLKNTFKSVNRTEGLWKGVIEGNGMVHLRLNIIRDGQVKDSRYMGRVFLANKSTWFAFKSTLPKERDWTWNIEAFNG